MQTGCMLLADITHFFHDLNQLPTSADFSNLMAAGVRCNFHFKLQTGGILLEDIT